MKKLTEKHNKILILVLKSSHYIITINNILNVLAIKKIYNY